MQMYLLTPFAFNILDILGLSMPMAFTCRTAAQNELKTGQRFVINPILFLIRQFKIHLTTI